MTSAHDGSLLLDCLGIRVNGAAHARPPVLTRQDAAEVVRQAVDNGVVPLLYHRLTTLAPAPLLPPAAIAYLRDVAFHSAARSLEISRGVAEVLEVLRRHDVPVIVLKGAHLGPLVYRNAALRTMGDVDVMVRRDHLARAEALLVQLGYRPVHDPLQHVDYARHHHTRPLGKPGGMRVDVHWNIARPTAPFDVDLEEVWVRAVPARIAGVEARVLSVEDLLLHLCLHASFDHKFRLGLRACWDILEVVAHQGDAIVWDEVVRRAERWGIGRYVYVTLRLVRELLAADVPLTAIERLEPSDFTPQLLGWARTSIFAAAAETSLSPSVATLWTSGRLSAKLAVLRRTLVPPRPAMARIYRTPADSRRLYLYYPLRWVGLVKRYGHRAWGLLRGDRRTYEELRAVSERAALGEWLRRRATSSAPS